jgi:hypothetical protein
MLARTTAAKQILESQPQFGAEYGAQSCMLARKSLSITGLPNLTSPSAVRYFRGAAIAWIRQQASHQEIIYHIHSIHHRALPWLPRHRYLRTIRILAMTGFSWLPTVLLGHRPLSENLPEAYSWICPIDETFDSPEFKGWGYKANAWFCLDILSYVWFVLKWTWFDYLNKLKLKCLIFYLRKKLKRMNEWMNKWKKKLKNNTVVPG